MVKATEKKQIAIRLDQDELEVINKMRRNYDDPPRQPEMILKIVRDAIADYQRKNPA